MHEAPSQNLPEKYKGRFVVVEIGPGGPDRSILNEISLPEDTHPLYLGIDSNTSNLRTIPEEGAPPSAMMKADITSPAFLLDKDLNGQVDRLLVFNVLSVVLSRLAIQRGYPDLFLKDVSSKLKKGGKALIGEWLTPHMVERLLEFDFASYGLDAKIVYEAEEVYKILRDEGISEWQAKYTSSQFDLSNREWVTGKPFLLILTPKE